MGGSEKWSVTYTKHIKQKRKVYQDGFLKLDASAHKVILYDDTETILHSRFLKKDDIIKSGETLAFDSYLVDIGGPHGDQKLKVTMESKSLQSPKFDRKPNLGMGKARMRNLSPSQKIIREFKKNEMNKYASSHGCSDRIKSRKMEWQVLYTTQITQKAKKYHDGILQLLLFGSQKQILLYDASRRLLDSRFLKKNEAVTSGEPVTFDGHLVDVGECKGDHKPMDFKTKAGHENTHSHGKVPVEWEVMYTSQVAQKTKKYSNGIVQLAPLGFYQMQESCISNCMKSTYAITRSHKVILFAEDGTILSHRTLQSSESIRTGSTLQLQNYLVELGDLRASCKEPHKEASKVRHFNSKIQRSIENCNISGPGVIRNPIRAAQEILSFLKKPMYQKDSAKMETNSPASQSYNVHNVDTGAQIEQQPPQDFSPGRRTVLDLNEDEENDRIHKQGRSRCIIQNMVDLGCTNRSATSSDPPTLEPKILVNNAMELDLKAEQIAPVFQDPSSGTPEKEYCTKPVSCEEDPVGGISPDASGITLQLAEEVALRNVTQPCGDTKNVDARSDTGVPVIGMERSNISTPHDFDDLEMNISEQGISTRDADRMPSFDLGF